jgi:hypothetical protein
MVIKMPYPPQGIPAQTGGGSQRLVCTITSDILYSDPNLEAERYTSSTSPVEVCQFCLNFVGNVRVYFELSISTGPVIAYGYVYRNGKLVQVVSTSSQNYVPFNIDLNNCIEGDIITVAYRISDSAFAAWLRRVRLLGRVTPLTTTPSYAVRRDA